MKIKRYGPILKPNSKIGAIFNCGATEYQNEVYLLPRVVKRGYTKKEDSHSYKNYISEIYFARSKNGKNFILSDEAVIKPDRAYDMYGCEDPRITKIGDRYLITYTALSKPAFSGYGARVGLASTKDFFHFKKEGTIGPDIDDKDAAIFPEKIRGKIVMLHRIKSNIQIAYFDNLEQMRESRNNEFWKRYVKELNKYTLLRREYEWEAKKIGAGPPPIKTPKGWLLIYHGVDKSRVYRVGIALLNLSNPKKVIARYPEPILEPEIDYEKKGDVPNVVFPTGAVVKNGELFIYYGAADKRCCLATCRLDDIIYLLEKMSK